MQNSTFVQYQLRHEKGRTRSAFQVPHWVVILESKRKPIQYMGATTHELETVVELIDRPQEKPRIY